VLLSKQPWEKLLKLTSKTGLLFAVPVPDIYEIRYTSQVKLKITRHESPLVLPRLEFEALALSN